MPRFKKFSDSSIFEEVFPSKRTKIYFGKISTYACLQALKFRMQALFFMQIQNSKSDFRFFDFLLFLGIKSETNHNILYMMYSIISMSIMQHNLYWRYRNSYNNKNSFNILMVQPNHNNHFTAILYHVRLSIFILVQDLVILFLKIHYCDECILFHSAIDSFNRIHFLFVSWNKFSFSV